MIERLKMCGVFPLEVMLVYQGIRFSLVLMFSNPFAASSSFVTMSQIANSSVWGIAFLLMEIFRLISIHTKKYILRRIVTACSLFLWSVVSYLFLLSNPTGTASVTYSTFAIMSAWVFIFPSSKKG